MSCKATIVLESDTAREAADMIRIVLGRSPINVTQNFGGHATLDLEKVDEGLPEHLDDAVSVGD